MFVLLMAWLFGVVESDSGWTEWNVVDVEGYRSIGG